MPSLRVPPPEVPVISWLTPNKTDEGLLEFWNTELASYVALDIGAAHPNARQYPNFRLGKQAPVQGDEKWVLRTWITDETNPDWFNWASKFAGEDDDFPIFIRTYREPRNSYTPRAKVTPLKTLYKLVITDPGSGYTTGTYPKVNFDAPTVAPTTEATAHGVVSPDGTITECVLDFGGDGYAQNVEFHVDPPVNGNPASGIAYVQPQSAVLTREEASLFPEDSEFYAQYLKVTRIYETIPGPPFESTKLDDKDGVPTTITTTRKLCSDCQTGEGINNGTWCKFFKKETDIDFICEEILICRALPGNPMESTKIAEDGKVITRFQTYTATASCVSEETLGGGTWTKKYIEDVDGTELVSWQWVETRDIPGNDMVKTVIDDAGDIVTETRTMVAGPPSLVTTITTVGGVYTKTFGEPISDLVSWQVVQVKATQNHLDSYEAEIPDLMPEEFRPGVPVTTHEETLIGTASAITLPLALGVLMEREAQIDYNTYRHTIRGRGDISLPQSITNLEITSEFGGGDVDRVMTLDLYNSLSLDEGLMVLSSNIRKIDDQANGLAVKTSRIVQGTSWPILLGTHVDEKYYLKVGIQRQTVDAGTTGGASGNTVIEVRPHDKWKSIQITSTLDVDNLPDDVQYFGSMQHSFPPELIGGPVMEWAEATCGCSDSFSTVMIVNMSQYSGIVKTRITEQFYNGVPPDDITIVQFFPQSHAFGYAWSSFCGTTDADCRTKSGAPEFHIPLCLHGDLTVCLGIGTTYPQDCSLASHIWYFPATAPATLPHGDYIMLAPHVERWRFGVFRRVLTEILIP